MNPTQRELFELAKNASGVLHLIGKQLSDADAQAIAEGLKVNTTLDTLFLGQNQIGDAGARAIAEAIQANSTLTGLGLYENQIGHAGAQAFAEALKENQTLLHLALNGNQIGDAGAQVIAEALKVNTTLTDLHLKDNFLSNAGTTALRQAGNTTCTLLQLVPQQRLQLRFSNYAPSWQPTTEIQQLRSKLATNEQELAAQEQELQQLRSDLAVKDQMLATNEQELAAQEQELQQLRSDLAVKDQMLATNEQELATNLQDLQQLRSELAAKDHELKAALDRIDVFERNQPAVGSASNFDGTILQVPLATLVAATNNFDADSLLGTGAFSRVYGATLPGPRVAIKRVSAESIHNYVAFQSELDTLSQFRHPNIIAILSYANSHDEYCLVYEFMPNGSVRDRLDCKNNTPPLTWAQRHRIAADVSRGMHYVQTAFPDHVLFHLDLKPDNVLLDAHFNAKVSDFGLVRAAQHLDEKSYVRTQNVQGTKVYMCPEYLESGRMTIKTDVYAFGMILLELVTAAKPGILLKRTARKAANNQKCIEMLDSALHPTEAEGQSVGELVNLALKCLDDFAADRPSFGSIVVTLDP
ncbi:TKL/IRAK protein kinase [Capsaspora owczarzaki ATCC 30864]|uniref:TKL/IRAK protein kinase n=1 Tax=Capsaspora owczarzaki (strain ATCC 30864) TaxID=595528 RepID=A0A0D2X4Y4_CAPO3|nr:TKL/IRAK protein kinase [Capsaspora owczarzaki ATCC 30864]